MKTFALFALFVVFALSPTLSALAAPTVVRVNGHGERKVAPDLAWIQIEIQSREKDAQQAQGRSAEAWARVEKRLKNDFHVEARDLQTSHIGVQPEYDYTAKGGRRLTGYLATHSLRVRCHPVEQAGKIVDAILAEGTARTPVLLGGISFSLEKPEIHEAETLGLAMNQARNRAEAIARAAGRSIGALRSVIQGGGDFQPVVMAAPEAAGFRAKSMATPTQVAPGEITISSDVTVEYEL